MSILGLNVGYTGRQRDEVLHRRGPDGIPFLLLDEGSTANGQRKFQGSVNIDTLLLRKHSNSPYLFLSIDRVQHQGIVMLQEFLIAWPDGSIKADAEFPVHE